MHSLRFYEELADKRDEMLARAYPKEHYVRVGGEMRRATKHILQTKRLERVLGREIVGTEFQMN